MTTSPHVWFYDRLVTTSTNARLSRRAAPSKTNLLRRTRKNDEYNLWFRAFRPLVNDSSSIPHYSISTISERTPTVDSTNAYGTKCDRQRQLVLGVVYKVSILSKLRIFDTPYICRTYFARGFCMQVCMNEIFDERIKCRNRIDFLFVVGEVSRSSLQVPSLFPSPVCRCVPGIPPIFFSRSRAFWQSS